MRAGDRRSAFLHRPFCRSVGLNNASESCAKSRSVWRNLLRKYGGTAAVRQMRFWRSFLVLMLPSLVQGRGTGGEECRPMRRLILLGVTYLCEYEVSPNCYLVKARKLDKGGAGLPPQAPLTGKKQASVATLGACLSFCEKRAKQRRCPCLKLFP